MPHVVITLPLQYTPASYALVSSQPCRTATVNTHTTTGDHFLIASVVMTALCCLVCSWLSLLCSIPAILFALSVRECIRPLDFQIMLAEPELSDPWTYTHVSQLHTETYTTRTQTHTLAYVTRRHAYMHTCARTST